MEFEWSYAQENVDWDELSNLYKIAPLGDKKAKSLETVFSNSMFKCFVYHDKKLIGAGRALADGLDCSYLCDIAINPTYQGFGLGKQIINSLKEFSKEHKKIILYANPGKEEFYKKLGFKRMSTAMAIFQNQDLAVKSGILNNL